MPRPRNLLAAVALFLLFGGCFGEDATAPAMARVDVSPASLVLPVGNSVTLEATATGIDDPIRWESTNPAVVTVERDSGEATGVGAGTAQIRVLAGGILRALVEVSVPQPVGTVTAEGGTLETGIPGLQLFADSGALSTPTPISVVPLAEERIPAPVGGRAGLSGYVYEFGPSGTEFDVPLSVGIEYDPADLPEGVSEDQIGFAVFEDGQWRLLPAEIDTEANLVLGFLPHFSTAGVMFCGDSGACYRNVRLDLSGSPSAQPNVNATVVFVDDDPILLRAAVFDSPGSTPIESGRVSFSWGYDCASIWNYCERDVEGSLRSDGRTFEADSLDIMKFSGREISLIARWSDPATNTTGNPFSGGGGFSEVRGRGRPSATISEPSGGLEVLDDEPVTFRGAGNLGWSPRHPTRAPAGEGDLSWRLPWDGSTRAGSTFTGTLPVGTHDIVLRASDLRDGTRSVYLAYAEDTVRVVVRRAPQLPVIDITSSPSAAYVAVGAPVTVRATASDRQDSDLDGGDVRWSSSLDGELGTGAELTFSLSTAGTHTITASVTDSNSNTSTDTFQLQVRANTAPTVRITYPTTGTTLLAGTTPQFKSTGTDPDPGHQAALTYTWSIQGIGELGTGAFLEVADLPVGTHTVRVTVRDPSGGVGSDEQTFEVLANQAPVVELVKPTPAQRAGLLPGQIAMEIEAQDPESGDVSSSARWFVDGELVQENGSNTYTGTFEAGRAVVRVEVTDLEGTPGSTTITLDIAEAPGVRVTSPVGGQVFDEGESIRLESAVDFDGDVTFQRVWTAGPEASAQVIGRGASAATSTLEPGTYEIRHLAAVFNQVQLAVFQSAPVTIRVNALPEVAITAPGEDASFQAGATQGLTLRATASDAEDGATLPSSAIRWTLSGGTGGPITGVGATFAPGQIGAGTWTATATVTDSDGGVTTAERSFFVNAQPTATISAPAAGSYPVGTNVGLRGSGSDAENGTLTGDRLTWSSDIQGVLGTGTAVDRSDLREGTHVLTLTVRDQDGGVGTANRTITITSNAPPVPSITGPTNGSVVPAGAALTLTGSATDAEDGALSGASLRWSSSISGSLGTGTSVALPGGLVAGTHVLTLTATDSDGASASTSVSVIANAAPTATITAPTAGSTFEEGQVVQFTATASDPEDGALTGGALAWSSDLDGSIGTGTTVSTSTLSVGTHVITLTATDSRGATAVRTVSVEITTANQPPVVTIDAPADGSVYDVGDAITFAGTATDPEDGPLTGGSVSWFSDLDGSLAAGTTFSLPGGLSAGTHTITFSAIDSFVELAQTSITVIVNAPPTASITSPASGSTFTQGTSVTLVGSASDPEDGTLSGTALAWTSSLDGALGTGTSLSTSTLSAGSHTITLTSTDSRGSTGTTTIVLNVTAANSVPTVSITSPADGATVFAGDPITFSGTASDAEDGTLSGTSLTWGSNLDGGLGTGSPLSVPLGLSPGTHTITFEALDSDGATGSTTITVEAVVPVAALALNDPFGAPTTSTTVGAGFDLFLEGMSPSPPPGPFSSVSVRITWDTSLVTYVSSGPAMGTVDDANAGSGVLIVSHTALENPLAELNFSAAAAGTATFSIELLTAEDQTFSDVSNLVATEGHVVQIN